MDTPVLLIGFNRPQTIAPVFKAIRSAAPSRLYFAVDGPRKDQPRDAQLCADVRDFATQIDWNCKLKTRFNSENLGAGRAVSSAIGWFFEHEPSGIILEDDCVPHIDYFSYCSWALEKFENIEGVWHISGNNFAAQSSMFNGHSIAFASLAQVWGWATWRSRWEKYIHDGRALLAATQEGWHQWQLSAQARREKYAHLMQLVENDREWDYQWHITVLNAGGLAVVPSQNFISNIGDEGNATRTLKDHRCHLPLTKIGFEPNWWNATMPKTIELNSAVQRHFETQMRLRPHLIARVKRRVRRSAKLVGSRWGR